jgi:hypothetical protein
MNQQRPNTAEIARLLEISRHYDIERECIETIETIKAAKEAMHNLAVQSPLGEDTPSQEGALGQERVIGGMVDHVGDPEDRPYRDPKGREFENQLLAAKGKLRERAALERERVEAVEKLLCEFRLQIEEFKKKERAEVAPLLMQGIGDWGRYIFAQDDPEDALARFMGRPRPGKRAKNKERDVLIAGDVATKMDGGMTLEEAADEVAEKYRLESDAVVKIYTRNKIEGRAARHQA